MSGQPFVHPAPAKSLDEVQWLYGGIQKLVAVEAERDAALAKDNAIDAMGVMIVDRDAEIQRLKATIGRIREALDECRGQSSQIDNLIDDIHDAMEEPS